MAMPIVPGTGRGGGTPSPGRPSPSPSSSPQVVSQPQQQKIIQDILDCIKDMKSEYESSTNPIDDDNQTLHRFCAKLEYLLQCDLKDKYTVLGKKKDYFDYISSCLGSTKGMNDGLKYVKTVGDYKTSLGKGRAYLRFCLMHQRLADSIQQCIMNGKVTSMMVQVFTLRAGSHGFGHLRFYLMHQRLADSIEQCVMNSKVTSDWYHPKSVWLQHDKSSSLVNSLYDLSELKFDLTPRGYDLDNAWPSFARKNIGSHNWNPPSRADSMSSLISIPTQDLDSSRYGLSSTPNDSIDHLTHELATSESVRSDLADKIDALEHQKSSFKQSIMETRKDLDSAQSQLEALKSEHESLLAANKNLQQKYDRLTLEVEAREKEWTMKENMYQKQLENSNTSSDKLQTQMTALEEKLQKTESSRKNSENNTMSRIAELESSKNDYLLQIRSLTQDLETVKSSDAKQSEIICEKEEKIKDLERKNLELLQKMESVLVDKNQEASSQLDSTSRLQEILVNLKEVETSNLKLKSEKDELQKQLYNEQTENKSLKQKLVETEESSKIEITSLNDQISVLKEEKENLGRNFQDEIEDLKIKFSQSSNELNIKVDDNTRLSEEVNMLKETVGEKDTEIKQFENEIQEKSRELKNIEQSNSETISKLQESLNCAQCRVSEQEDILNKLNNDLHDKDNKLLKLNEKVEQVENERSELRKTVNSLQQCNQELENSKSDLDKELNSLKEQQNIERGTTDEVKDALENKMALVRELETKVERMGQVLVWIGENNDPQEGRMPPKLEDEILSKSVNKFWENFQDKCTEQTELKQCNEKLVSESQLLHLEIGDKGKQLCYLNNELSTLKVQYENICASEKTVQQEKVELERKLEEVSHGSDTKTKELEQRNAELINLTKQCDKLKCESENSKIEISKKLEEIVRLKDATSKTEERLQQSETNIKQGSETQQKLKQKIEQQENVIKESKDCISNLENDIQKLDSTKDNISREKENVCQENEKLKKDIDSLQKELGEKISAVESNNKVIHKNQEDKCKMEQKYKDVQTNLFDSEQKLSVLKFEKEKQEKEQKKMLEQLERERKNLTDNLEEALSDLQSIKEHLNETSTELENAYLEKEKIESEKAQVLSSKAELESLLAEYTEKTEKLDTELENRKQDLANFKNKFSDLEVDNENLQKERTESQEELERVRSDFETVRTQKEEELKQLNNIQLDLSDKLFNLNEENCRINEILENLKKDKNVLLEEKNQVQERVSVLESEIKEKSATMADMEQNNSELLVSMETLKNSLEEKEKKFEADMKKMEEEYKLEIDALKQENSAMQFQLSSEQMQHEEALQTYSVQETSITDMKEKLFEQETMIEQLELQMKEIGGARDEEKHEQQQQLEEILTLVNTKEMQLKDTEIKLQKKSKEYEEEKSKVCELESKLEEEHSEGLDIRKRQEDEIMVLKSDMTQLKKKLVKLIKEKDSLWQKTDRLTFQQKIQAKEKWMDDGNVTKCMGCTTEFSFTLRKHHCRVCGRIFCYNCSNNWIMTAHSSKKERACNGCYIRQSQLESDSSLVDNESDNDFEESVDLPKMHKSRNGSSVTQTLSTVTDEEDKSSSTLEDDQSDQGADGPMDIVIPGQIAAGITVSMVDNETDEFKAKKVESSSGSEDRFHLISDEEIAKSLTLSDESQMESDPNMTKSIAISTGELEKGEVNSSNEIWIKPGKTFAVPVLIENVNTTLCWEFTSHPKDVVFSVCFQLDNKTKLSDAQTLVPSCKCESHKQAVKGELTAKQIGIYTLVFDNTYSRLTSKKISYSLWSKKSS